MVNPVKEHPADIDGAFFMDIRARLQSFSIVHCSGC
jgi:hypothetical protein